MSMLQKGTAAAVLPPPPAPSLCGRPRPACRAPRTPRRRVAQTWRRTGVVTLARMALLRRRPGLPVCWRLLPQATLQRRSLRLLPRPTPPLPALPRSHDPYLAGAGITRKSSRRRRQRSSSSSSSSSSAPRWLNSPRPQHHRHHQRPRRGAGAPSSRRSSMLPARRQPRRAQSMKRWRRPVIMESPKRAEVWRPSVGQGEQPPRHCRRRSAVPLLLAR